MSRNENKAHKRVGRTSEGLASSGHYLQHQSRFAIMPPEHLSSETRCGIRDMKLGRIGPDGRPRGAPTIRFDTGLNTRTHPHININPTGLRVRTDPHIKVPRQVVECASYVNSSRLNRLFRGSKIVGVMFDAYRLTTAVLDGVRSGEEADKRIAEIEAEIRLLTEQMQSCQQPKDRQFIQEKICNLQKVLIQVRSDASKRFNKSIVTGASIAGGWAGACGGASAGAWTGTGAGGIIGGMCGGPPGAAVGAPIGCLVGGISGAIGGAIGGSEAAEYITEKGLDYFQNVNTQEGAHDNDTLNTYPLAPPHYTHTNNHSR